MLRPVFEPAAPTVGDLVSRGYLIVDDRPIGYDCGPGCIGDGFDAVYLGIVTVPPQEPQLAEYACPGIVGVPHRDWKCRRLLKPYAPNSGRRP